MARESSRAPKLANPALTSDENAAPDGSLARVHDLQQFDAVFVPKVALVRLNLMRWHVSHVDIHQSRARDHIRTLFADEYNALLGPW